MARSHSLGTFGTNTSTFSRRTASQAASDIQKGLSKEASHTQAEARLARMWCLGWVGQGRGLSKHSSEQYFENSEWGKAQEVFCLNTQSWSFWVTLSPLLESCYCCLVWFWGFASFCLSKLSAQEAPAIWRRKSLQRHSVFITNNTFAHLIFSYFPWVVYFTGIF